MYISREKNMRECGPLGNSNESFKGINDVGDYKDYGQACIVQASTNNAITQSSNRKRHARHLRSIEGVSKNRNGTW